MDPDRRIGLMSDLRDDPEAMLDDVAWAAASIAEVRLMKVILQVPHWACIAIFDALKPAAAHHRQTC